MIVVTAAIIEKDGLVLAARRCKSKHLAGYWELPGGKLEDGESPAHCLTRELKEEFDVEVSVGPFFDENTHDYDEKVVRLLAYQVTHNSGDFKLIDHDKILWLAPEDLGSVKWAPADIPLVEKYQLIKSTQEYYSVNAQTYCDKTKALNLSEQHQLFLSNLRPGAHILDIGCGSGRDSRAFIDLGYKVTAIDTCPEIATLASNFIGQSVIAKSFLELEYIEQLDGIWASASLVHCTDGQFKLALSHAVIALVGGGVMFLSVKKGDAETIDSRGRYFNNHTVDSLSGLLNETKGIEVMKVWESSSVLRSEDQTWVQALVRKTANRG